MQNQLSRRTKSKEDTRTPGTGLKGSDFDLPPEGASMVFPLLRQSAGVMEPGDFRFKNSEPREKECMHLNLKS